MTDAPQKLTVEEIDAFERIAIREMGIVGLTEAVCALARRAVSQEGTEDATTHTVIMTADRIAEDICNDFDLDMEYVPLVAKHLYEAIAERDKLKIEWADDANQYEERIAKLVERVNELEEALEEIKGHCEYSRPIHEIASAALEKIKFRNHPGTTNHELAKEALSRTSEEA
jgi:hypothetical protein